MATDGPRRATLARRQKTGRSISSADAKRSGIRRDDFAIQLQGDTGGMGMPPAKNALEPGPLQNGLASRYEALIRLAEAIRSHPDEKDLFRTLVNELHEVVEFDALCQFDGTANWVQWYFAEPYNDKLEARRLEGVPKEETAAWWVYRNQQPVAVRRTDQETRFPLMLDRLAKLGLNSACVLPLSTAHRKLGSLAFTSRFEDAYSPDEQRFLSLVANQIALAIDDARAQQRLSLLLDLTNRVVRKLELRDLLHEIALGIRHVMQCDGVGVALPDAETGELHLYFRDLPSNEEIVKSEHVSEATEYVFRTGEVINLTKEHVSADSRLAALGLNSLCSLPLLSRGRVLGVLGVGSSREGAFLEDDISFLGQVANQIAIAVENASAYGEISQLKDRLAQENVYLESEIRNELLFEDIVGNSRALQRVLRGRDGRAGRLHGSHLWRDGHREGIDCPRCAQSQLPQIECFCKAELRSHSNGPAGKRTIRPRKRRLHRSDHATRRALRAGTSRNHLPR